MLCKKCGFDLSDHANFCPNCGSKVAVEDHKDFLRPAKWLKIVFGLILAGLVASFLLILFSDNLTDTVSGQLDAIKKDKLTEAYYGYTSKMFQKATSLENFKKFMKAYPIFSHHESVRFIDRHSDEDRGSLQALITSDRAVEVPVHYQLVKEGDRWLIERIKIDESQESAAAENQLNEETFDSTPLKKAIVDQMNLVRQHDFKQAYDQYTSQEFKQTTSFKDFEEFIKENPSFINNKTVELNRLSFDNNIATMTGVLKTEDGKAFVAEYDLLQENGDWKIFHIKVFPPKKADDLTELKFSKFVLGSKLNDEGLVSEPRTVFKSDAEDIYLNLYADHIHSGTKINVVFEHVDSNSRIPPVSKVVSEDGNVILTFIFSPPESGWPKGNYRILASSSLGDSSSYDFKVE